MSGWSLITVLSLSAYFLCCLTVFSPSAVCMLNIRNLLYANLICTVFLYSLSVYSLSDSSPCMDFPPGYIMTAAVYLSAMGCLWTLCWLSLRCLPKVCLLAVYLQSAVRLLSDICCLSTHCRLSICCLFVCLLSPSCLHNVGCLIVYSLSALCLSIPCLQTNYLLFFLPVIMF